MRPDSLPRLWRYVNLLLTYLLTIYVFLVAPIIVIMRSRYFDLVHRNPLYVMLCYSVDMIGIPYYVS